MMVHLFRAFVREIPAKDAPQVNFHMEISLECTLSMKPQVNPKNSETQKPIKQRSSPLNGPRKDFSHLFAGKQQISIENCSFSQECNYLFIQYQFVKTYKIQQYFWFERKTLIFS